MFLQVLKDLSEGKGQCEKATRNFYKDDVVPPVVEMMLDRYRQNFSDNIIPRVKEIFQKKDFEILLDLEELEALADRQVQIHASLRKEFT